MCPRNWSDKTRGAICKGASLWGDWAITLDAKAAQMYMENSAAMKLRKISFRKLGR